MAHHSIILENKLHARHKTHLHTMKFNDTRPVRLLLIKILFFRPPKCSLVPKESTLSSHRILGQNCCGWKALNPSFLRKTCMASVLKNGKKMACRLWVLLLTQGRPIKGSKLTEKAKLAAMLKISTLQEQKQWKKGLVYRSKKEIHFKLICYFFKHLASPFLIWPFTISEKVPCAPHWLYM